MIARTAALILLLVVCDSTPQARERTRQNHTARVTQIRPPPHYRLARDPAKFYPEQIEGGVRGNLSFNNQLRKFTDPLNANGGGG